MASKKIKPTTAARLIDPDELLEAEDFEFEDFLEEIGPEISTVSIFRVLRDGSREQIDKVPLSELLTDVYGWLREQCGTGKYQLYFRGADRRYRGAKTVVVGERKQPGAQPAANNNGNSTTHDQWMEKQFTLQQNLITGMLAAMKGPDLGSLLAGLAHFAPKPQAQADPAAMLTAVATVFSTLRGPGKDEDWLARAKTIIELAKDLQPEDRGGDTVWSVVKDVGKEVVHRLGTGTTGLPEPPAAAGAITTMTPVIPNNNGNHRGAEAALEAPMVAPAPGAAAEPTNGAGKLPQNVGDWIRVALGYLKDKARQFKEPEIYVDQMFDNIEEPQWAAVVGAIREGATFENLLQFDTEISQNEGYVTWFRRLYDGVHAELFQAMDSRGTGGNQDHTGDHARASVAG